MEAAEHNDAVPPAEQQDPFADVPAADPPPVPTPDPLAEDATAADPLPPGVEPGQLGGVDGEDDPEPDPLATPAPTAETPETPAAPEEQPEEPETPAEQPAEPEEPAEAPQAPEEPQEAPPKEPTPRRQGATGGPPLRQYAVLARKKASEIDDPDAEVFVRVKVGNDKTITARNGTGALREVGRSAGPGFDEELISVPMSQFTLKRVRARQQDSVPVEIG